jgi:hypothetical protein
MRVKMLHQHECHACVVRHGGKEVFEGSEATRGGTNTNDDGCWRFVRGHQV